MSELIKISQERETEAMKIIKNKRLTFMQQVLELYKMGEDSVGPITVNDEYLEAKEKGILCDLYEGNGPFRPRYTLLFSVQNFHLHQKRNNLRQDCCEQKSYCQ